MNIYYVAHPVTSDEMYSLNENLTHTVKVLRTLYFIGINAVAPWHTLCLALREDGNRERCLDIDYELVRRFSAIILTGHKLSSGMTQELEVAKHFAKPILNLIGVPTNGYEQEIRHQALTTLNRDQIISRGEVSDIQG